MKKRQLRTNINKVWDASERYHFAPSGHPVTWDETEREAKAVKERVIECIWRALAKPHKWKDFDAFWKQVPKHGAIAIVTLSEMREWSEKVFTQARATNES